jgi:hypothetical protein
MAAQESAGATITLPKGLIAMVLAALVGGGAAAGVAGATSAPRATDAQVREAVAAVSSDVTGRATSAAESRAQQVVRDESAKLGGELSRDLGAIRSDLGAQNKAVADTQAEQARALIEIGKAVARIEGQLSRGRR